MTRINTYKLKNGVSKEDLSKLGFREGSWHSLYEGTDCMSKFINLYDSIELHITIKTNPIKFDDFEDTLVLDDDFCQPYTPFYGDNYKKDVKDFSFLEKVIDRYNQVMDSQGVFEVVSGLFLFF